MPGVQCVICLSSDTSTDDWCALKECGHVFHTHCAVQALEHSRRCPQCRTEYCKRKYGASNPPYQRVFFEFSEELSQPDAGCGAGTAGAAGGATGGAGDPLQLAFLQGQLRDKERRIQTVSTQLAETEERGVRLERDLEMARQGLREGQAKLQEKIAELSREHKHVKALTNQLANAQSALKAEQGRASLLALCSDHTLAGPALSAEVDKLVRLGMRAPNDFWERLMSERSQLILAASNRHAREKAALEKGQAELQAKVQQLQDQVAALKRSLAAARQHQPGRAAPATAAAEQHFGQARYAGGAGEPAAGGPRHRPRRLAGSAAAQQAAAAEAAAEEEDPLLRSYDVLGMRQAEVAGSLLRPQRAQQAQQAQPRGQAQQQPAEPAAAAAPDCDDDLVVLDGSEEQEGEEGEELELEAEDNDSAPAQQAQQASQQAQQAWQQQQQAWQQQQQQQSRTQQTAAGPAPVQQRQQQAAPSSSSLGKRPAAAPAAPPQPAARSGGSQGADENVSGWAVPPAPAPLLATAGPGRAALQQGPGRSFIRNPAAAGIGLDRGRFISSGPDGKGGVVKAYLGSGAAPVRLAQKKLDTGGWQGAGGSSSGGGRRGRSSAGSSQEVAAAQALRRNNGLPITSFFSKQQQ